MRTILIFTISVFLTFSSYSQISDCNCCTESYMQFDFWIGEWDVFDSDNSKVGENTVIKLQDNCVIQENWISESMTGTSYNYYNSEDSTWNQVWIDNAGASLVLKGKFSGNRMIMKSDLLKGQEIDFYYNRIIWEKKEDGTVIQTWNTFDKEDQIISTVFEGTYIRKD